jgi:heat shock protein HtpX
MNAMKTFGLLTVLTVLVVAAGQLLGGTRGAVIALIVAAVMNLGSYWFSDRLVLMRYRAREVPRGRMQRLDAIVDRLIARGGLPRPRLFVIPSPQPNAFATGRDPAHAAVAVTEGLLHAMNDDELEGVIAHELAHVKHRDILIGSIAATLAGAVMLLATMARWGAIFGGFERDRREGGLLGLLALAFVAPLAATLVQLAVSRSREFAADRGAAEMVGHPHGLASALRKLDQLAERVPMDASPASAHMFIVSPLRGRGSLLGWFSTHPPITARIERLLGPGR